MAKGVVLPSTGPDVVPVLSSSPSVVRDTDTRSVRPVFSVVPSPFVVVVVTVDGVAAAVVNPAEVS